MRDAALSRCELQTEAASQRIAPRRLVSDAAGRDAVKRATRVFRKPSAEGYGETLDFGESDLLTPEFAPPEFALRLDELESL